jgi:hypothetical protein
VTRSVGVEVAVILGMLRQPFILFQTLQALLPVSAAIYLQISINSCFGNSEIRLENCCLSPPIEFAHRVEEQLAAYGGQLWHI